MSDKKYMQIALNLAHRGLGRTWPNPSVGCVIVKDGEIIARTRTANSGRPHAESLALKNINAKNATVYVTLEPCSHHGKTPPCAEALVEAGVAEVVIGCIDSDKRVSGNGIKILEKAGIKVTTGILEKECRELNKGFFKHVEKALPYVMLKIAVSKDAKYLSGDGKPKWVTGELARNYVQLLRSQYEAILTGTGTVLADNPQLNCRLSGMEDFSPVKIVVGETVIPKTANIFNGKETWLYSGDLKRVLKALAERGITRIMVEAGPTLSNAFLKAGLVDEVVIFQSPQVLGKHGDDFFAPKALDKFHKIDEREIGDDLMLRLTNN